MTKKKFDEYYMHGGEQTPQYHCHKCHKAHTIHSNKGKLHQKYRTQNT